MTLMTYSWTYVSGQFNASRVTDVALTRIRISPGLVGLGMGMLLSSLSADGGAGFVIWSCCRGGMDERGRLAFGSIFRIFL